MEVSASANVVTVHVPVEPFDGGNPEFVSHILVSQYEFLLTLSRDQSRQLRIALAAAEDVLYVG